MTNETTTQTPAETPAAKPKAYRVNLVSGAKRLKIEAHPRREAWKFYVEEETRDKKGKVTKRQRGAFATFPTVDAARAHADSVAAQARKDGWAPVERKGGFAPKPEAFTLANLPKPDKK